MLHRQLFGLLVLFLPFQIGRHFWPEWSYVLGLRVDYLSPTFYLTDFLVIAILSFWFLEKRKQLNFRAWLKNSWWILAFFVYLLITSFLARNPGAALYKFFKIGELAFLAFYVEKTKPSRVKIASCLSVAIGYSALIALAQFLKQASLNGFFWYLGERTFTKATPGIAKAIIGGRLLMRPYATFPHPNVLAGFILVSLVLISQLGNLSWLTLLLGTLAILISFSRSVWLVGLLVLLAQRVISKKKPWLVGFLVIFGLTALVFLGPRLSTEEAVVQRLELVRVTGQMIKDSPLTGVGLNNFIVRLPEFWQTQIIYWLQPVHNIFLLVATETGLVGLAVFLWLLILALRKTKKFVLPLLVILALGLFDHYWLTLQQTQLLLAIVLGLSWAKRN